MFALGLYMHRSLWVALSQAWVEGIEKKVNGYSAYLVLLLLMWSL